MIPSATWRAEVPVIDASNLTDQALKDYHEMMAEATLKVRNFAPLAVNIWSDVLRELSSRGHVRLISGSFDDIGNSLIETLWETKSV